MSKKLHIKKGDQVKVIAGNARGESGRVISIDRKKDRATVEGLNLVSRHVKPDASNPQGGIVKKEAGIHLSNLMLVDAKGKDGKEGKQVKNSKKSGEVAK